MNKDYILNECTSSLCPQCLKLVQAQVIIREKQVFIRKLCPEHGEQLALLEEDAAYHRRKRQFDKVGTDMVRHTPIRLGCPFDCGICPAHDQHACIGLIEITRSCNMKCPVCYASAGESGFVPLERIEEMMDFFVASEYGQGEILQISGGEPTLHPDILGILEMTKSKPIRYVMLNTNGLRISMDEEFVRALKPFVGGFEVYLQFDGFKTSTYETLRGADLLEMKYRAIDMLSKHEIPTTLVVTVTEGVNDDEVGAIFNYALNKPYIRGINFQPAAFFGRNSQSPSLTRTTLSGVLKRLEAQTGGMLTMADFIPLPCNVERVAITYMYRDKKGSFIPITRDARIQKHLHLINNTFVFTVEDLLKNAGRSIRDFKSTCECFDFLHDFRKMVPMDFFTKSKEKKREYIDLNTFRVSVSAFVDIHNFDLKSMQKECVHVITPELRKIPFSSYNMLYREEDGDERVDRQALDAAGGY